MSLETRVQALEEYVKLLQTYIDSKVDKTGDTMTGQLRMVEGEYDDRTCLVEVNNNGKNANVGWSYPNIDGAGAFFRSSDWDGVQQGGFGFYARSGDGSNEKILEGRTDGSLLWNNGLIPYGKGTNITPTFRQCTNGAYTTCRKIGNLVILSFNINVTTATESYDYLTGLPNAVGAFAGSSAIGTSAGRWWVTGNGTLRFDGTPTIGWHNGNIVYVCE